MVHDLGFLNGSLISTLWGRKTDKMYDIYFILVAWKMCMFVIKVDFYTAALMISHEKWVIIRSASPQWAQMAAYHPAMGEKMKKCRH